MNYRFAEDKDKVGISQVLENSFDSTYAYYAQKSFASLENSLIAEEDGVAGVTNWKIIHSNSDKIGYIFWLAVHPDYRRKGIGEGLIQEAINCMQKEAGSLDIYSATDKDNIPMHKLFGKMGFTPDGRSVIKKKYGVRCLQLYSRMMLMPWEVLFIKPG